MPPLKHQKGFSAEHTILTWNDEARLNVFIVAFFIIKKTKTDLGRGQSMHAA